MLVLVVVLVRLFGLFAVAESLHLVTAVLFEDLEAASEALALLLDEDALLGVLLLVGRLRRHLLRPVRLLVVVLLVVHWHCRLPRQV